MGWETDLHGEVSEAQSQINLPLVLKWNHTITSLQIDLFLFVLFSWITFTIQIFQPSTHTHTHRARVTSQKLIQFLP